jgi:hypothetical protein
MRPGAEKMERTAYRVVETCGKYGRAKADMISETDWCNRTFGVDAEPVTSSICDVQQTYLPAGREIGGPWSANGCGSGRSH